MKHSASTSSRLPSQFFVGIVLGIGLSSMKNLSSDLKSNLAEEKTISTNNNELVQIFYDPFVSDWNIPSEFVRERFEECANGNSDHKNRVVSKTGGFCMTGWSP